MAYGMIEYFKNMPDVDNFPALRRKYLLEEMQQSIY